MKQYFKKILIILAAMLFITSCKKDSPPIKQVNLIGTSWELYSARVFVKNLDNNSTFYYDHFGPTKSSSNLDIYTPSWLPIDIITKGMTTWKFTSSNQFVLDGGSSYNYNVSYSINSKGIFNVYGLENGSARPIIVLQATDDFFSAKIYESYGNDGTYNYSFYTVLTFVRKGFTEAPTEFNVPIGYSYNGILGGTTIPTSNLIGTKWVVTKYIQNLIATYPHDTLNFISATQYKINSSVLRNYTLSNIVGTNMKSLSLYSFTTLGGDWSGQVQGTFINDWVINNAPFTSLLGSSPNSTIWMMRTL